MMTVDRIFLVKFLVLSIVLQSCMSLTYADDYYDLVKPSKKPIYKNADYTPNKYNPLNTEEDIWRQRQADQAQLRFIQTEKNNLVRTSKTNQENCKNFDLVKGTYIL